MKMPLNPIPVAIRIAIVVAGSLITIAAHATSSDDVRAELERCVKDAESIAAGGGSEFGPQAIIATEAAKAAAKACVTV
jgi:hypothetical protein